MKQSGTRFAHWLNRAILGLLGTIFVLLGAGILALGFGAAPLGAVGRVVVLGAAVASIAAGLRQVYRALVGRFPPWYPDFILHVGR